MSEICPTTGFSKKSKERWPYLWGKLTSGQSNEFPNQDQIKSIDRGIKEVLKVKDSSTGEENRQNLIKHLRKIICSKIKEGWSLHSIPSRRVPIPAVRLTDGAGEGLESRRLAERVLNILR